MSGRILLIPDGPAALTYAPELIARLRQRKFTVQVAPTAYAGPSALAFISELAWTTLSGHPCLPVEKLNDEEFLKHDLVLLAPVTQQVMDIFCRGKALEYLQKAARPLIALPARLASDAPLAAEDFQAKMPPRSMLSQGDETLEMGAMGTLKLTGIDDLLCQIDATLGKNDLDKLHIMVTAGPTVEDIDPVRFLTNRSTGKMGVALAAAAAIRGAEVTLIHGPLQTSIPAMPNLHCVPIRSAEEMHAAVMARWTQMDVAILAAAVADFRPDHYAEQKIKKVDGQALILNLRRTSDILAELGSQEKRPFLIGFAAESDDVEINALTKLRRKHCDVICANDIRKPGCGFAADTNQITLYSPDKPPLHLPMKEKRELAHDILTHALADLKKS